jgi:nicotinamide riboside kinase
MKEIKQYTFKIVTTGPESSGKTVLAKALATYFKINWAPEFARHYLTHLGRDYVRKDLVTIGRGQLAWENWYAAQNQSYLICDTDWTVLQVWEQYRFGPPADSCWQWQAGYPNPKPADLYLLCVPDFSWHPDPLREHPDERQVLFHQYEHLLKKTAAPYLTVHGEQQLRLQSAISLIHKLFGPL